MQVGFRVGLHFFKITPGTEIPLWPTPSNVHGETDNCECHHLDVNLDSTSGKRAYRILLIPSVMNG